LATCGHWTALHASRHRVVGFDLHQFKGEAKRLT
jgi:hypothetical protein